MYAASRIRNGGAVQGLALLGPTFSSMNENGSKLTFDSPNGGWKSYMDFLLVHGTDIMIVDDIDGGNWSYLLEINIPTAAENY